MIVTSSNTTDRNLEFNLEVTVDGINANVKATEIKIANGTLSYVKENDTNEKRITNYTQVGKEYTVLITESGTYTFKLQDNTSDQNNIEKITIKLANKPQTDMAIDPYNYANGSENWAYAEASDSAIYVWIPRFVYNESSNEIKFIKGNSNIATDNTYINETDWTLPAKFESELTGLWVKVTSKKESGLNMINLLNGDAVTLTEIKQ